MRLSELPESCPECGHNFSRFLQQPRWQKKAILLLVAGSTLTIPWIVALTFFLFEEGQVVNIGSMGKSVGLAAVIMVPAILAGVMAYRTRRVVALRCRKCGWSKACLIDNPQYRN